MAIDRDLLVSITEAYDPSCATVIELRGIARGVEQRNKAQIAGLAERIEFGLVQLETALNADTASQPCSSRVRGAIQTAMANYQHSLRDRILDVRNAEVLADSDTKESESLSGQRREDDTQSEKTVVQMKDISTQKSLADKQSREAALAKGTGSHVLTQHLERLNPDLLRLDLVHRSSLSARLWCTGQSIKRMIILAEPRQNSVSRSSLPAVVEQAAPSSGKLTGEASILETPSARVEVQDRHDKEAEPKGEELSFHEKRVLRSSIARELMAALKTYWSESEGRKLQPSSSPPRAKVAHHSDGSWRSVRGQ
ncbi:MAG: hypothetical protein Q9159_007343 [Coniocarpon cinnabarinum]